MYQDSNFDLNPRQKETPSVLTMWKMNKPEVTPEPQLGNKAVISLIKAYLLVAYRE